jgi:hypothetical protein
MPYAYEYRLSVGDRATLELLLAQALALAEATLRKMVDRGYHPEEPARAYAETWLRHLNEAAATLARPLNAP